MFLTARQSATSWRITNRGRLTARNKPEPRNSGAFLCASHAHIKESLSVVSLGKPLTFGGFAVRQAHA
nr:MAG TPA: hypothetical protein [Caudoviricetes sp.]